MFRCQTEEDTIPAGFSVLLNALPSACSVGVLHLAFIKSQATFCINFFPLALPDWNKILHKVFC